VSQELTVQLREETTPNNLPKQQELNTGLDFVLGEHRGAKTALCLGLRKRFTEEKILELVLRR